MYNVDSDAAVGIPKEVRILPQYLKPRGYATGVIGKWHVGGELEPYRYNYPLHRGFDRFWGFMSATHDYFQPEVGSIARMTSYVSCGYSPVYDQERPVTRMNYLTEEITGQSIRFIEANQSRPFCLYMAHHCAHGPLQVPREVYERYAALGLSKPAAITRAMYEVLDRGIGRLLDTLDRLGLAENTLIIYSSDNGAGDGQNNGRLRGSKFNLMEGGIRVPLAMRWPARLPAGKLFVHPVINIDFLPTILAAAGIEVDPALDGVNLLPYLLGDRREPHGALYWKNPAEVGDYAIRRGDWKLVYSSMGQGLFNLREDPGELRDRRKSHAALAAELEKQYRAWDGGTRPPVSESFIREHWRGSRYLRQKENYQYSGPFGEREN